MVGATLALGGAFMVTSVQEAEASSVWNERSLTEIQTDIESKVKHNAPEEKEVFEYEIQWGDTLGNIAEAVDIDLDVLANANGIANKNLIIAGQTLLISEDAEGHTQVEVKEDKPVTTQQTEVKAAPVEEAKPEPAPEPAPAPVETPAEPVQEVNHSNAEAEAKEWIAQKESGGDYNAVNPTGKYIGRYQLTNTYLNGDHSPENQERVAEKYVRERYGSWVQAKAFWVQNGWY